MHFTPCSYCGGDDIAVTHGRARVFRTSPPCGLLAAALGDLDIWSNGSGPGMQREDGNGNMFDPAHTRYAHSLPLHLKSMIRDFGVEDADYLQIFRVHSI